MKTAIWFLAAILAIPVAPALSGERPTAEELLSTYQRSVEQLTRARIDYVDKVFDPQLGENGSFNHELTIVRDGSRWKVSVVSRTISTVNGTKSEDVQRHEAIFGEQNLLVSQPRPDLAVRVHAVLNPTTAKKLRYGKETMSRAPLQFQWRKELGGTTTLYGRITGDDDQPIWDVMREATTLALSPDMEEIEGVQTYVVKSVGKFGEHTLWLDPACGSLPRRIEVQKQLGNLLGRNQLGSRIGIADEPPRQPGRPMHPPDHRAFSARIDKIQIENRDGNFVMTAWKAELKFANGNGKSTDLRSEHSVAAVDFKPETWPKDVFAPGIEIPDKTLVRVQDGLPGTEYEWVGGKIQVRSGK